MYALQKLYRNTKVAQQYNYFFNNRLIELMISPKFKLNIKHFLTSKSKMGSFILFTTCFWMTLDKMRLSEDYCVRLAGAGALVTHLCEMSFYLMDTVNSKSKVS